MFNFLNWLKSLAKNDEVYTDNNVFQLHCRFTVMILIVFSIIVTSKQYFGDPIDCDVPHDMQNIIDTYCWIYGTYTISDTLAEHVLPGLGNHANNSTNKRDHWTEVMKPDSPNDRIIWHKYYQWVGLFFCLQALLFYIPRYLWNTWEGGRIPLLVKDLGGPVVSPSWRKESKEQLITYMLSGTYSHNIYSFCFVFCETLNLANVIGQIAFINRFLGNQFLDFGIAYTAFNTVNPLTKVFPKLTKCTYFKYGPSGSVESRDALCVLSLNNINEKVFIFLWFWLHALALISIIQIVYRFLTYIPRVRVYLLMARARYLTRTTAEIVIDCLSFGDYFVLCQLRRNINALIFKDLVTEIGNTLIDKANQSYNHVVTTYV